MGKLTKKNKAFMLMILGIILLIGGIAVSISLGAKNIDINTILRSILSDGNDINTKISTCCSFSRRIFSCIRSNYARDN